MNEQVNLPEFLKPKIDLIAKSEGFENFTIDTTIGSANGDGFVATILRVAINGEKLIDNKLIKNELVLVCKILPENELRRNSFGMMDIFEREVLFYNEVLPALEKFQTEKGISKDDKGFWGYPKCYNATFDRNTDNIVIIMEDLREHGYQLMNKYKTADFDHTQLVMIELGRLHAISFALRKQEPELFNKFKNLNDFLHVIFGTGVMLNIFKQSCATALTVLEPHEEDLIEKITDLKDKFLEHLKQCVAVEPNEPYCVISHGDCWINNMMFHYKNDKPNKISLIDWQLCRYVSPAIDVTQFIFLCTDKSQRDQHYINFINIYYKSLSDHLAALGGNVDEDLPYNVFEEQLKRCGKFGLCLGVFAMPLMTSDPKDIPMMEDFAEKFNDANKVPNFVTEKNSIKYRERMRGIITDVINFGYL